MLKKLKGEVTMDEKKNKKKIVICVAAVLAMGIIIIIIHKLYDRNRVYESYKVEYNSDVEDNADNMYYAFGAGVLKYSSDGMSYINEGKEVWNHGFEIKNPIMDICGDYVAVAQEDTNDISIYGASGEEYRVSASYPIKGLEVSAHGVVAAVMSDDTANYIELISKDGTQIAIGRTVLQGDGYPVDISLSEDATKVAASYLAVSSGEAQTKLVFYNYSEVGQNETDRIVGGFNDFKGSIVPDIEFVNSNTVVAIGDDVAAIYNIKETPSERARIKVKGEIKSVIYNDKYIAMVMEGDTGSDILKVYNMDGKRILSKAINFHYTGIKFAKENIILYNDTQCKVISVNGVVKFDYTFGMGISSLVPLDDTVYILVSGGNIQKIRLS